MSDNLDPSQPFHNDSQQLSSLPSELHSKIQQLLEENDRLQQLLLEKQTDTDNLLNELNDVKQSYQDQFVELMEKVDKMGQLIQSQEEHNNEVVNDHKKKSEILRRVQAELQAANEAKDAAIQQADEAHSQLIEEQNRCALYLENFQNIETQIGYVVSENEGLNEAKHALEITVQQLEEHVLQLMEEHKDQLKASQIQQSQVLQGDLLELDVVENAGEKDRVEKEKEAGNGRNDDEQDKEDLREQLRHLEKEISRLNQEKQELSEKFEKERKEMKQDEQLSSKQENNDRSSGKETQEELQQLQRENESLREQVQHCMGRIASLLSPSGSTHRLDSQLRETSEYAHGKEDQQGNSNSSRQNPFDSASNDQKDGLLEDLRLQVTQLRSETLNYQEQYQGARSDLERLRLHSEQVESEKQTLLSQVSQLKDLHSSSQLKRSEYSQLISKIENEKLSLKAQLNDKISENEQLNRELLKEQLVRDQQKKTDKGEVENEAVRNLREQLKQAQNIITKHAEDLKSAAMQYREAVIEIKKANGRNKGNSHHSNSNGNSLEVAH